MDNSKQIKQILTVPEKTKKIAPHYSHFGANNSELLL